MKSVLALFPSSCDTNILEEIAAVRHEGAEISYSSDESLLPRADRALTLNGVFIEHRGAIEAPFCRVSRHGRYATYFSRSCSFAVPTDGTNYRSLSLSLSLSLREIRRDHPRACPRLRSNFRGSRVDSLLADARESRITRRHVREHERNGCLSRM